MKFFCRHALTCRAMEMMIWGRFLRLRRFLNGCLTSLATRLASTSSKNSGSTLSVPRIFFSTAFPSSVRPRSMRLLGVSTTNKAPTVRRTAGIPAKPRDSLQPHPPLILSSQNTTSITVNDAESEKEKNKAQQTHSTPLFCQKILHTS